LLVEVGATVSVAWRGKASSFCTTMRFFWFSELQQESAAQVGSTCSVDFFCYRMSIGRGCVPSRAFIAHIMDRAKVINKGNRIKDERGFFMETQRSSTSKEGMDGGKSFRLSLIRLAGYCVVAPPMLIYESGAFRASERLPTRPGLSHGWCLVLFGNS
jgi:hypothetical protein